MQVFDYAGNFNEVVAVILKHLALELGQLLAVTVLRLQQQILQLPTMQALLWIKVIYGRVILMQKVVNLQ
ncbi:MAG: hypothetical protein ACNYPH_00610 [Gammaproteobacteria bacterium WSBS_2016_MAG_OTU1]